MAVLRTDFWPKKLTPSLPTHNPRSDSRTLEQIAFRAYQQSVKEDGEESPLPQLRYTLAQLFWISQASFFCEVRDEDQLDLQIQRDKHSSTRFRSLSNEIN